MSGVPVARGVVRSKFEPDTGCFYSTFDLCSAKLEKEEEGARQAARDDPDRVQWRRNRRGDGEGETDVPASDV